MATTSAITSIILFLLYLENVLGSEETSKRILAQSLKSPKISQELKLKLEDPKQQNFQIVIEFEVGNGKPIEDFKEASISSRSATTKGERHSDLVSKLQHHATTTQAPVLHHLQSFDFEHESLWLANEIYVKDADVQIIADIVSKFDHISNIRPPGHVPPPKPVEVSVDSDLDTKSTHHADNSDIPQPIQQIQGRCGDIQCLGEGTVVAVIDTGVLWTHEEITDNYRRDFGWYDPNGLTEFPFPSQSHGTHVTGIIVGKTKGVAPRGQWIACLGLPANVDNNEPLLKKCAEWALCPFRWNSTEDRNCSAAPDVINNSWGASQSYNQGDPTDIFYSTVAAWNAAGIISFFSAGNDGPFCSTMVAPALYNISFSVAAVDNTSTLIGFSSRGPVLNNPGKSVLSTEASGACKRNCLEYPSGGGGVTNGLGVGGVDGLASVTSKVCTITKPEISAPGVRINSSISDSNTSYTRLSGTSMASPMVAGVTLLMICANKQIPGRLPLDVKTAHDVLKSTANTKVINLENGNNGNVDLQLTPNHPARSSHLLCNVLLGVCGFPNNLYGHGLVDACKAVRKVTSRH